MHLLRERLLLRGISSTVPMSAVVVGGGEVLSDVRRWRGPVRYAEATYSRAWSYVAALRG
jgi:hypothetical protein